MLTSLKMTVGQVEDQVRVQIWDQLRVQAWAPVNRKVRGQVEDQVWVQIWDHDIDIIHVYRQVEDQVWDHLREPIDAH